MICITNIEEHIQNLKGCVNIKMGGVYSGTLSKMAYP